MFKVLELAANKAFEVTHYNLTGMETQRGIKFNPQSVLTKKVREFFNKNNVIKTFLAGMDKRDERVFLQETKGQQFNAGDRVIRRKTRDRALFFVVSGTFFSIDDNYPATGPIYRPGAVIGVDQFLDDDYWNIDLIC
jgi:hypothetical protein